MQKQNQRDEKDDLDNDTYEGRGYDQRNATTIHISKEERESW